MLVLRDVFEFGGAPVAVVVADLSGKRLLGRLDKTHAMASEIDLTGHAFPFDADDFEEREHAWADKVEYNELTLAPKMVRHSDGVVDLTLEISRYSKYRAAADMFGRIPLHRRIEAMRHHRLGTGMDYSHSLGVNCTLETADGQLLWTKRATNGAGGDLIAPAMSEGSTTTDLRQGSWDPSLSALRGFDEELNLQADDFVHLEFHSLIAQIDTGAVSVLGHARTSLTAAEVLERRTGAIDYWESESVFAVPASAVALQELAENSNESFVSWAPPALTWLLANLERREAAAASTQRSSGVVAV